MDVCPRCKGAKKLILVRDGHIVYQPDGRPVLVDCPVCSAGASAARRQRYLEGLDGLTPDERQVTLNRLLVDSGNRAAIAAVAEATAKQRGLCTLTGAPGVGKTTLLVAAVNAGRQAGLVSVYTTLTDLLDYLKAGFSNADLSMDARWRLLVDADVLAVDELAELPANTWSYNRFLRLVDERWRRRSEKLTLFALDTNPDRLPAKVTSRLNDQTGWGIIEIKGKDRR